MPPEQITNFLQYGYGTFKDQSAALLSLYTASLAFLAVFSDKVLNIAEATSEVRGWVNLGLYALIGAVVLILFASLFSHAALSQLQLWSFEQGPPLAYRLEPDSLR